MGMTRGLRRGGVLAAYVLAFGVALPVGLWETARWLDGRSGWSRAPSPWGAPVLAAGLLLLTAAVVQLFREGRGLPVSALPPPRLARRGPYRFVRHPIYLGFNIAVFGAGLATGSRALAWVVAPLFAPLWIGYALVEERFLRRRFGRGYARYCRTVGLVPRLPVLTATRVASLAWPIEVEGAERVPRQGPAVLVANHCCYLDPVFMGLRTTFRRVHYLATAELYRNPLLRAYARRAGTILVRRYAPAAAAWREVMNLLEDGEVVAVFVEGERSALGSYEGAQPGLAGILARLPAPVIPVGVSGSYDCGPRWAGILRRGPVTVRVGPPLQWTSSGATRVVDVAIRSLLDKDPPALRWSGLPTERLGRVLWRCPRCLGETGWRCSGLACLACGERYVPLPGGGLADTAGGVRSLPELARRVWNAVDASPVRAHVEAGREEDLHGPVRPLRLLGRAVLVASREEIAFGALRIPLRDLRSISVEGADRLQVATASAMWQFRILEGSAFRMRNALSRWRGELRSVA